MSEKTGNEEVEEFRTKHSYNQEFLRKPTSTSQTQYSPVLSFDQLVTAPYNFPEDILQIMPDLQYSNPMPVQSEVIPIFHQVSVKLANYFHLFTI